MSEKLSQQLYQPSLKLILTSQTAPLKQVIRIEKLITFHEYVYINTYFNNHQTIKHHLQPISNKSFKKRNNIINLVIHFHRKLKLDKFVLFEAISIISRFIKKKQTFNTNIIIALAGLILASKKISVYKIKIKKWIKILNVEPLQQAIIRCQSQILQILDFSLDINATSLQIAFFFKYDLNIDSYTLMFCRYLLQLSFFLKTDYEECEYLIGISCLRLSCFFLQPKKWNQNIIKKSKISIQSIDQCSNQLFNLLFQAKNNHRVVYQKFKKSSYYKVSSIQFGPKLVKQITPQTSSEQDTSLNTNHFFLSQESKSILNQLHHQVHQDYEKDK